MNRIVTFDDLINFCELNHLKHFDVNEYGSQWRVSVPATFEVSDEKSEHILYGDIKIMHTNTNRNTSNATLEGTKKAMTKLAYKPVLANFADFDDGRDFTSHDIEIDEDGNTVYIEHQVGCFTTTEPYLEYDEKKDRHYLFGEVAIPREYTDAAEIIERKGGTKVSAELLINQMSYDAEKRELILEDFEIMGVTLLGRNPETGAEISEGMEGARLDIKDFSAKNKIDIIQELKDFLDDYRKAFEAKDSKEGGLNDMNKFDELLEQYGVTVEDVTFAYEDLSDDELQAKFEETFGTLNNEPENNITYSVTVDGVTKTYAITMREELRALSDLVNLTYGEADNDWYSVDADADHQTVYMHGWNKSYRQTYSIENDVVTLTGDREEVFSVWMTADERAEFENMKANYSSIVDKLNKYEDEPNKINVLASEDYASIADNAEFIELAKQENHFDLTVEEVTAKADAILLNAVKQGQFNFAQEKTTIASKPLATFKPKKKRYGKILEDII